MPYPGVPNDPKTIGKMERCVSKVIARGKPKSRAIAICHSGIVGKESDMSSSRKKRKNEHFQKEKLEREAEERGEALGLIGTVSAEVQQEQVIEPTVEEPEEVEVTPEEEELVEEVLEEIDEEDEDTEETEETGDGEEKGLREEKEKIGVALFEKFWNFIKSKFEKPEKKELIPFKIFKDARGDYRYIALVSNNFVDRDDDIITDEAHKEFMEHLDAHPEEAPELWVWHTPGTAHKSRADFWEYENGFVMYSGKLTEEEAMRATKAQGYTELGMSHGLNVFGLKRDERPKLITKYRTFEISYLPLSNASNPWTAWSVIQKEVDTMKDEKKKFLIETLGQEAAEALIADTGKAKQVLNALGVASKETTEEPQAQPVEPTIDVEAVVKAVADRFGMDKLSEAIAGLVKSVEELKADKAETQKVLAEIKKTEDEKVAELVQTTPAQQYFWMGKALSQSDDTLLKPDEKEEDKKLLEETPRPSWISQVLG